MCKFTASFYLYFLACWAMSASAQSLEFTTNQTWVSLGKIDVSGNQITVEALINPTTTSNLHNIVSKHNNPSDVNYLLRPNVFSLNAGNQFYFVNANFTYELNEWYHVAGTYDGQFLRYYVNGCLTNEVPASGNLFQNNHTTKIGYNFTVGHEQFFGKVDEVRIWNTSRSQTEIEENMLDLPNPTAQPGLLAYYKLDNSLENNQGNPAWNGSFVGNIPFSSDEADVQPFAITDIILQNTDCEASENGSITINTNRPAAQYSLDGVVFQTSNIFSGLNSGSYTVYIASPEGCVLDTVLDIGDENYYFPIIETVNICEGESYQGFSATGVYSDTLNAAVGCDSIHTIELTVWPDPANNSVAINICEGETYAGYAISGVYVDAFTSQFGCDSIRTLLLTVNQPVATMVATSICQGEEYAGYTQTGTYIDVLTTATGCDSTRTLLLTVHENRSTNQALTICPGSSQEFGGLALTDAGVYSDTLTTYLGCDSIITLDLNVANAELLGNDTTICTADELVLKSNHENTRWFDGEVSPVKTVRETGVYWASVLDANGCEIKDTIAVQFNTALYLPNAFSPNGDGINDCFKPFFSTTDLVGYSFAIYDRWGGLVYRDYSDSISNDPCGGGWNGQQRGKACSTGTYIYIVIFENSYCGRQLVKGDVILLD